MKLLHEDIAELGVRIIRIESEIISNQVLQKFIADFSFILTNSSLTSIDGSCADTSRPKQLLNTEKNAFRLKHLVKACKPIIRWSCYMTRSPIMASPSGGFFFVFSFGGYKQTPIERDTSLI